MTFNARRWRDFKITRNICRITLDDKELALRDVYYVDTRRGIVRGYCRNEQGKAYAYLGPHGLEIAKFEKRGKVRFWLRDNSTPSGMRKQWGLGK